MSEVFERPITPKECEEARLARIPNIVVSTVNKLLKKKFDGTKATITIEELLEMVVSEEMHREVFFENHYLDFEDLYRQQGWNVTFDKSAFNENYKPYWIFKIK